MMTEDERAIRTLVETWMQATRAGDVDTVLSLMADDVIFLVPGQKPFGKEAFAATPQGGSGTQIDGRADVLEVEVRDDRAYLRNYIEVTITHPGAAPERRSGYTLSVLRKEPDGRWLLARDANLVT